ncbi:hypothetical protein GCM10025863_27800 [Microbacterium suwonense]|uniref:Uncharacterized protein n=1 Tax=Microbacterium suwonense TaxID=683047 RepID=A0ABM8FX50_9MICO|nr:hypothetical protein GCM10025863_27800 [Microbacterium suwonense]
MTTARPAPSPSPDEVTTFTFADGATLTEDTSIGWGDGLGGDAGWKKDPSKSTLGRFAYDNAADTCTATFQLFRLDRTEGISDMDDRQASDVLMWQALGTTAAEGSDRGFDGRFLLNQLGGSLVEGRQFSVTINDVGLFSAARAFVAANRGLSLLVSCEGPDIGEVAHEVLSKTAILIDLPS